MSNNFTKISLFGAHLADEFQRLEMVGAFLLGKKMGVYLNRINAELNLTALEFFCVNYLGGENQEYNYNNEIVLDYDANGCMAFCQIQLSSWFCVTAIMRDSPLVNLEIKKVPKDIEFDLEEVVLKEKLTEESIIVEKQENIVDEKLLSAKRLQHSILPDLSLLGKYFKKHFSYYSPEDVLGGDFYWLKEIEESLYIVVADCTGHSVEGALATMTVNTILNQRVVNDPSASLQLLYEDLLKGKSPSSSGYSVGLELAILRYDKNSGVVDIATSGVPVLYIEKGRDNYSLLKINGTQKPDSADVKIKSLKLDANIGDRFILYTDGLADQFDKDDKKKLGNAGIRKMFLSMNGNFSAATFEQEFGSWKGQNEQLDDFTVLAFEI